MLVIVLCGSLLDRRSEAMGGRTKSQRRAHSGALINVYPLNTTLGWAVVDQVDASWAAEKLACRKYREVRNSDGSFAGIQPCHAEHKAESRYWKGVPSGGPMGPRVMQLVRQ